MRVLDGGMICGYVPGAPCINVQYLPDGVLCYLLPSRYCESDHFNEMATEITAGLLRGNTAALSCCRLARRCASALILLPDGPDHRGFTDLPDDR